MGASLSDARRARSALRWTVPIAVRAPHDSCVAYSEHVQTSLLVRGAQHSIVPWRACEIDAKRFPAARDTDDAAPLVLLSIGTRATVATATRSAGVALLVHLADEVATDSVRLAEPTRPFVARTVSAFRLLEATRDVELCFGAPHDVALLQCARAVAAGLVLTLLYALDEKHVAFIVSRHDVSAAHAGVARDIAAFVRAGHSMPARIEELVRAVYATCVIAALDAKSVLSRLSAGRLFELSAHAPLARHQDAALGARATANDTSMFRGDAPVGGVTGDMQVLERLFEARPTSDSVNEVARVLGPAGSASGEPLLSCVPLFQWSSARVTPDLLAAIRSGLESSAEISSEDARADALRGAAAAV